jgi:outer membrane biosynthesis protein TonB
MQSTRTAQTKSDEQTYQKTSGTALKSKPFHSAQVHPLLQLQGKIGNQAVSHLIQAKLKVGQPGDIYEQEADRTADTVMRMPEPLVQRQSAPEEEQVQAKPAIVPVTPLIQRQTEEEKKDEPVQMLQRQAEEEKKDEPVQMLQRQAEEEKKDEPVQAKENVNQTPEVDADLENQIQSKRGSGQPLPPTTRNFFESRFGYDFSKIRLHTDSSASKAAGSLNAQAFTIGQDIFFGAGHYEPDTNKGKWLLAHELTHTVQQQPQPLTAQENPTPDQEVQRQTATTEEKEQIQPKKNSVNQTLPITATETQVQGDWLPGLDSILNWIADRAANIPGFTLLTVIIGRNPINNRQVERNAVNLTRGLMGLVPGGDLIFKALQDNGILDKAFAWLNQQIGQLNITWDSIKELFSRAWKEVSITDGFDGAFEKIKRIFGPPYERVKNFVISIGKKVIEFIKEAILKPVGQFAQGLPGYPLLRVILGKDPITGEPVERDATNLVGGILDLIPGGQETFKNLQESKTIERAVGWLTEQIRRLNLTWQVIKGLFSQAWDVLSINDLLSPSKAFEKIRNIFSPPFNRIKEFAIALGKQVLEFIFEGALKLGGPLAGAVLGAIKQAGAAFSNIIKNPAAFAGNLVKAIKQGLHQFSGNIVNHLKTGLTTWLFGALATAGITIPQQFDLKGIVSLVLQVLGLTYARLRGKLVDLIGEKPVAYMEKTFDFLVTIATEGLAAAWEKIVEFTGSLEEMVMGGIRDWVGTKIVTAAITKLASLFNPAGAIIQAIISIYNTVAFFMERAQQIAALVNAVSKSIGNVAAGAVGAAANFIEMSMAKAIPVMLGFLSRFIGLGNVAEPIQKVIQGLQEKVWGAITKIANFIAAKAKSLFGLGKGKDTKQEGEPPKSHDERWNAAVKGVQEDLDQMEKEGVSDKELKAAIPNLRQKYGFTSLIVESQDNEWVIKGSMSPLRDVDTIKRPGSVDNPFKLTWPKPPSSQYPTIYLGGPIRTPRSQSSLKTLHTKGQNDFLGYPVKAYTPHRGGTLPEGPTIGISSDFRIAKGTIIGPLSTSTTPGGKKLNNVLSKYGFVPSDEGMDADHVWEIQFGGQDALENLWPLDSPTNQGAGSKLSQAEVEYPNSGKKVKIAELKQNLSRKYYFEITGFSS